jgi:hypothetical protein
MFLFMAHTASTSGFVTRLEGVKYSFAHRNMEEVENISHNSVEQTA